MRVSKAAGNHILGDLETVYVAQDRETREMVAIKRCSRMSDNYDTRKELQLLKNCNSQSLFNTMMYSSMKGICVYDRLVGFRVDSNGVLSIWGAFRLYEEGKST